MSIPSYTDYVASLSQLRSPVDPTLISPAAIQITAAATSLAELSEVTTNSLTAWAADHPRWIPTLGLTVGLSQESLKNVLRHHFNSSGWVRLARTQPAALIEMLDEEFDLVRLVAEQRDRTYGFGDVLVARAGGRGVAASGIASGRKVEDEIEAIAQDLGLPCSTRTRFTGRNGRTAPCDLAIPSADNAQIVVAAKGFDSTGSKLTDAVREIEEMADVRLPRQYALAVIDGIGWKNRAADLRRIYDLWATDAIDGMYTVSTLDRFRFDVQTAARRLGLLP